MNSTLSMSISKRTRILIVTHSPTLLTGMAETTRLIFTTLLAKYPNAYEVFQIGLNQVGPSAGSNWPVFPTKYEVLPDGRIHLDQEDQYGKETFKTLLPEVNPDIVFAFNDPQHLEHFCIQPSRRQYKLILYVNFDGFPVPPDFHHLFHADRIVTMSEFAKYAFLANHPISTPGKVDYVYAPADTQRFRPPSERERIAIRREFLPPWMPQNAFVLGWVGKNQWRKQVWILYHVIHMLRSGQYLICTDCGRVGLGDSNLPTQLPSSDAHGASRSWDPNPYNCLHCGSSNARLAGSIENIFLWFHMPRNSQNTWPVDPIQNLYALRPGKDIHYTEGPNAQTHLTPVAMPKLYQLWDALLYLSGGEGFGVPAWEAMSSGLPVVYTNYSAHAEFLGKANAGLPVGGILQPEAYTCILRLIANVSDTLEAVRTLYYRPDLRMRLGLNGRSFVEEHKIDIKAEHWHRIFQECVST